MSILCHLFSTISDFFSKKDINYYNSNKLVALLVVFMNNKKGSGSVFRTIVIITSFLFCVLQPSVAKPVDGSGWKSKSAASSHCCCGCVGECKCSCEKNTVQEKSSSEVLSIASYSSQVRLNQGRCHCHSSDNSNIPLAADLTIFEYSHSQVVLEGSCTDFSSSFYNYPISPRQACSGFSPPGKFRLIPLRI